MASSLVVARRWRQLVLGLLAGLIVSACAAQRDQSVDWHEGDSYAGWVTDAATGEPIEGAIVVIKWEIEQHAREGRTDRIVRLEETLTDRGGRFAFAALGNYSVPIGWERSEFNFPRLAFFKPGYEPASRQRFTWEYGERPGVPKKESAHPPRNDGWQREIQLYRYLTSPPSTEVVDRSITRTDESRILDRLTGLASLLARNVQNSGDDTTTVGIAQRRKAVETQWHAITALDGEIRKYRPQYSWSTREIREALRDKRAPAEGK